MGPPRVGAGGAGATGRRSCATRCARGPGAVTRQAVHGAGQPAAGDTSAPAFGTATGTGGVRSRGAGRTATTVSAAPGWTTRRAVERVHGDVGQHETVAPAEREAVEAVRGASSRTSTRTPGSSTTVPGPGRR